MGDKTMDATVIALRTLTRIVNRHERLKVEKTDLMAFMKNVHLYIDDPKVDLDYMIEVNIREFEDHVNFHIINHSQTMLLFVSSKPNCSTLKWREVGGLNEWVAQQYLFFKKGEV